MCSSTGSRSFRASSESRSASNFIDPLRSANSTVTCFRSIGIRLEASPLAFVARRAIARSGAADWKSLSDRFLSAASRRGQRFLKGGLVKLGYYMEGQNIAIVNRFAFRKPELLPKLATKLVNLKIDVIVSGTLTVARCEPPQVQSQRQHPGWKF